MKDLKKKGYWYIDERGNRWSEDYYTYKQAVFLSDSLVNCTNCTDCSHCTNCNNCIDCELCSDCEYCLGCIRCVRCNVTRSHNHKIKPDHWFASCKDCTDCTDCSVCHSCTDCKGCENCSNCVKCQHSRYINNRCSESHRISDLI